MLVKCVGADSLDQILDCLLNLIVLALEFLRLGIDPFGLHFDKVIESVGG